MEQKTLFWTENGQKEKLPAGTVKTTKAQVIDVLNETQNNDIAGSSRNPILSGVTRIGEYTKTVLYPCYPRDLYTSSPVLDVKNKVKFGKCVRYSELRSSFIGWSSTRFDYVFSLAVRAGYVSSVSNGLVWGKSK